MAGFFKSILSSPTALAVIRWFDAEAGIESMSAADPKKVDWLRIFPHYAVSARQGFFWWEIDITYYLLVLMSWLGIVRDLRLVPKHILDKNRIIAEPST